MTLKMELENLEGLSEEVAQFYAEENGKYVLKVDGHVKNDDKIPLSRLNQEIEKRKAVEKTVAEIADSLIEAVPEEFRDIVPNVSPAEKIKWLRIAELKGLFSTEKPSIDSRKPGDKAPKDFSGQSPQAIMAQGYGKKG
jgi:hypothetical protein